MFQFAAEQAARRLAAFDRRLRQTGAESDPEYVHQLRVDTRRIQTALRVWKDFFPNKPARKLSRRLSKLRDAAGAVRDCDIALELIEPELAPDHPLLARLSDRRQQAALHLREGLERWRRRDVA